MLRALLWKEWRTQRPLVLAGIGISMVFPLVMFVGIATSAGWRGREEAVPIVAFLTIMCVWPVLAAAFGATAFGSEMADGSMQFLLSRPVSRSRLWLIKLVAGLGSYVVMLVATIAVLVCYALLAGIERSLFLPGPRVLRDVSFYDLFLFLYPASILLLLFACSMYCSMFARRPLIAALGGALIGSGIAACVWLAWSLVAPSSPYLVGSFYSAGQAVGVPAGALSILVAGYWAFCRGDIFGPDPQRRMWAPLLAVTVLVAVVGLVPAVLGGSRQASAMSMRFVGSMALRNGYVVFPEIAESGLTTRLARVDVVNDSSQAPVAEHATMPAVSDDGEWIAYLSFGSQLGMLADRVDIRSVRADGTDDHIVIPGRAWSWRVDWFGLSITPDSEYVVAFDLNGSLSFAALAGGPIKTIDLDLGSSSSGFGIIGWATGASPTLLYHRVVNRIGGERVAPRTQVRGVDLLTRDDRLVHETPVGPRPYWFYGAFSARPDQVWEWLPVMYRGEDNIWRLHLIQTASGETLEIVDHPCRNAWGFSDDGSKFLYGRCPEGNDRRDDRVTELRVRDLRSGADERFAELRGYDYLRGRLHLSPAGHALLMYARTFRGRGGTFVVRRDGGVHLLARGYRPVAWLDADEALVGTGPGLRQQVSIAAFNVENGNRRNIFASARLR